MLRGIAGREADLGGCGADSGLPNHIYLAQVEQEAPQRDTCAPFTEPCAGSAGLEADEDFEQSTESFEENAESVVDARSQAQKEQVLTCHSDTSRPVDSGRSRPAGFTPK